MRCPLNKSQLFFFTTLCQIRTHLTLQINDYTTDINSPKFPHRLSPFLENTHEVVLRKSLSGLGFSFNISQLHSAQDRGSVVRIKRLFPGQPALESGLLREGDVILSVNRESVKDLSYQVGS